MPGAGRAAWEEPASLWKLGRAAWEEPAPPWQRRDPRWQQLLPPAAARMLGSTRRAGWDEKHPRQARSLVVTTSGCAADQNAAAGDK